MRNYIILFFFGMLFLFACNGDDVPAGIIPKKQMISLLTEIHVADGSMYTYPQQGDSLYNHGIARYLQLFKNYHTDTTQFKESMIFYTSKNEMFDAIYDQVIINLNAKKDSLDHIRKQRAKADSIKNAEHFKYLQDSTKKANEAKAVAQKTNKR